MKRMVNKRAMGKKGVINIVELVVVVITLFVSFSTFFPRTDYKNRWEDAYAILKARDMILLLERTGDLHTYAFDPEAVGAFFEMLYPPELESPESNLIVWSENEGGIKSNIKIACDCPSDTIMELTEWTNGLKINERSIIITYCSANLDAPGPCIDDSDAMLIWGYKQLQPYEQTVADYVAEGNGIIEVMDFDDQSKVNDDSVQTGIFGLNWIDVEKDTMDYVEFSRDPINAADMIFEPYKYFYHIPLPLKTTRAGSAIEDCDYDPAKKGTFNITGGEYGFWICNDSSVWFDTNGDDDRDTLVKEREQVVIGSYTFMLNYINSDSSIAISFKPDYIFDDFLGHIAPPGSPDPPGKAIGIYRVTHIEPIDGSSEKVLLDSIDESPYVEYPAVIMNQLGETNVAWVADFSEGGYGDDEKMLLTSLVLRASNKQITGAEVSNLRIGYFTSYVNIKNLDMFEVYKFSLGLGYPF